MTKSTTGHCIFLGSNPVSWSSKKQHVVSRSSAEAEYRSFATVVAEITWLKSLLTELHFPITKPPTVFCDNLSAVMLVANPILHSRTKHFELDLYFVREKIQQKELFVHHIPSAEQTADILTKPVTHSIFETYKAKLKVLDCTPLSLHRGVKGITN